jgi:hypothetical protein
MTVHKSYLPSILLENQPMMSQRTTKGNKNKKRRQMDERQAELTIFY